MFNGNIKKDKPKENNDNIKPLENLNDPNELKEIKFKFDKNFRNENLIILNKGKTVENKVGWEDASILGNIEMSKGKYYWEIKIDSLTYDNWLTLGIAEKEEISKNFKDEHLNSWSISSTQESWRMKKPTNNLREKNIYSFTLDFENDQFKIEGPGIDSVNEMSIKNKKLFLLVNLFNTKNKISVISFKNI